MINPPEYSNNNLQIIIDNNNLYNNNNNIEVINTPITPPPDYDINNTNRIDNPIIQLDLDSIKRKTILYNLTNTLKTICYIYSIYSLIYIYYSELLIFVLLFILSLISYYGIKNYSTLISISLYIYLIFDNLIKIFIIIKHNNIIYSIIFTACITINFYISYLLSKWYYLKNNLINQELLEIKEGFKPDIFYLVWY
tara:strand:- start:9 stop:596 length:588 start_codon:yes stop_codon:yes gene_type:complete